MNHPYLFPTATISAPPPLPELPSSPPPTVPAVAAANIGQSLTKRGRNGALRIVTGHDMEGFAEQDWRGMARAGEVAAIYMGKKSARFIQGRLMMHGADPATPKAKGAA